MSDGHDLGPANQVKGQDILTFWFVQTEPQKWFTQNQVFDGLIEQTFKSQTNRGLAGGLEHWGAQPESCLALILLLDQFTRNIYRGSPQAFAGDLQALSLSEQAVANGWLAAQPSLPYRQFFLMPLMHSEQLSVQQQSLPLFAKHTDPTTLRFAQRHAEIIERFGRFPHRNAALGRSSTPEEISFLKEPGSSF